MGSSGNWIEALAASYPKDSPPLGGNCATFVSSAMAYGGGLPMQTEVWENIDQSRFPNLSYNFSIGTDAWSTVGDLNSYLTEERSDMYLYKWGGFDAAASMDFHTENYVLGTGDLIFSGNGGNEHVSLIVGWGNRMPASAHRFIILMRKQWLTAYRILSHMPLTREG